MRRELWRRSNPAQRRNEMMACIKNLKLIVEMRGDCAMSSTLPAHPTHVRKTPASYIAKYIRKNIDGRGLGDTVSKDTRKLLRDSVEFVAAWASRAMKTSKPGALVLMDPKLDAVLAAADVGCFATYIMKQGGVLVPRKNYLIHTAYEPTVEPGTYGDHGIRIYGIWSPITGKENKICTHVHTWKMVKKAPANPGAESAAQGDPVAPWIRGNSGPQTSKDAEK